jgi:hypothetical protein
MKSLPGSRLYIGLIPRQGESEKNGSLSKSASAIYYSHQKLKHVVRQALRNLVERPEILSDLHPHGAARGCLRVK